VARKIQQKEKNWHVPISGGMEVEQVGEPDLSLGRKLGRKKNTSGNLDHLRRTNVMKDLSEEENRQMRRK